MRSKIILLIVLICGISQLTYAEYIDKKSSAYTYKATFDNEYWRLFTNQVGITGNKSGSFNITTTGTGQFGDGVTTGLSVGGVFDPWGNAAQFISNDGTGRNGVGVFVGGAEIGCYGSFDINAYRNTFTTPDTLVDGDVIGQVNFWGWNSIYGGCLQGATIEAVVDGIPGVDFIPSKLKFICASLAGPNTVMEIIPTGVDIYGDLTVDTITEHTVDAGVTIEGIKCEEFADAVILDGRKLL